MSFFADWFNYMNSTLILEICVGEYDFTWYYLLCIQTSPHSSTNCGFHNSRKASDMLKGPQSFQSAWHTRRSRKSWDCSALKKDGEGKTFLLSTMTKRSVVEMEADFLELHMKGQLKQRKFYMDSKEKFNKDNQILGSVA